MGQRGQRFRLECRAHQVTPEVRLVTRCFAGDICGIRCGWQELRHAATLVRGQSGQGLGKPLSPGNTWYQAELLELEEPDLQNTARRLKAQAGNLLSFSVAVSSPLQVRGDFSALMRAAEVSGCLGMLQARLFRDQDISKRLPFGFGSLLLKASFGLL